MSSHDWSHTVHHDLQHAGAAAALDTQASGKTAHLGRWSAALSTRQSYGRLQHARYAGQAAALLLGVVGMCSAIAHVVFG